MRTPTLRARSAERGAGSSNELTEDELRRLERAFLTIVRSVMSNAHRSRGLEKAGYVILVVLEREGNLRLSELAGLLSLDLSTVSRQVKTLADQGFVGRAEDPADRRASVIALTDEGAAELGVQRAARWAPVSDAISAIAPTNRTKVLQFLDRLADACKNDTSKGS